MEHGDKIQFPQLPFLTREMLAFGNKTKFELAVRSNQTTQRTIEVRGFTRSGRVNIKHIGTSTTLLTETIHQVGDIPIMLAVAPTALANSHGDLFVSVSLRIDGDISIPLVSGYVTQAKGLSWPGTDLQSLIPGHGLIVGTQVTAPAAGAEFTHTITANRVLHIFSLTFRFVTDANAANRTIGIIITHDGTSLIKFAAVASQTASLTRDYTFSQISGLSPTLFSTAIFSPLPAELWVIGEDTIETETTNIQVGDQFSLISINGDQYFNGA